MFADTWPGKYSLLKEALDMVRPGGVYIIDDMDPRADWPDGHMEKAKRLLSQLWCLNDWTFSLCTFGTGVGIGQRGF